jgi:hypothetical protein
MDITNILKYVSTNVLFLWLIIFVLAGYLCKYYTIAEKTNFDKWYSGQQPKPVMAMDDKGYMKPVVSSGTNNIQQKTDNLNKIMMKKDTERTEEEKVFILNDAMNSF